MSKLRVLPLGLSRDKLKVFAVGLGVFFALFIIILAGYVGAYKQKVLLNSYFLGENISGENKEQIEQKLESFDSDGKSRVLVLKYENERFEKKFEELGWDLQEDQTVDQIFSYGHSQNTSQRWLDHLKSIFVKKRFTIVSSLNYSALDDWMGFIEDKIARPKKEANIVVRDEQAEIIDPETGTIIDKNLLDSQLEERFSLASSDEIDIQLIEDKPLISREQAEKLKEESIAKTAQPMVLVGPGGSVTLWPNTLGKSLKLKMKDDNAFISLDEAKIKSTLEASLSYVNIEPEDASFSILSGNIILKSPSREGQVVKIPESVQVVIESFEEGKPEVELPYEKQEASISAQSIADIQKYGVREIIGKATTDFSNSPSNRVHNIKNGVQYVSGALVKSGEEFSTVGRLGRIDATSGYLPELVIKEDETVPEFGGGLCQVSTTLFRAAMNAGLKITERQNHSYRVSYYEPPVGMDATIYSPQPDLKFINTTDNAILVYGYVSGYRITFEIYGTADRRQVELTEPEIFDITDPPEPIYVDDPTLEPGEEKRIEKSHSGAKSVFYYKVRKDGQLIEDEKFISHYVAWPAKYLRGPQSSEEQKAEEENG
jgi:vancomycin resistance protein YoaR